jgi:hypothetical protein
MEPQNWVRRLKYCGSAIGGAAHMISLDADALIQVAKTTTGLTDFGGGYWEDPYRRLLASIEQDVELHTLGRVMTFSYVVRALRNRLFMTDALRRTPAILDEPIDSPVVIAGQGRTCTSILFELLALDPNHRAPLAWEAASPVAPPPATLASNVTREQIAETVNEFWADIQPEISAAHEFRWDLPVECPRLMESDFSCDWWAMLYAAWSYLGWRQQNNPDTAYDWHKNVLRVLQHGQPLRRWLLKSPAHLRSLDKLLARYPDAKIIHTHRDPVKTIPSTISLTGIVRASRAENVNVTAIAPAVLMGYDGGLRKVMAERAAGTIPQSQIVDVHFQHLMRDAVGTVQAAYQHLGLEFSEAFAQAIRVYLKEKPREKFGKHYYAAEDYGLTNGEIRERFRFYTDHYGVELE